MLEWLYVIQKLMGYSSCAQNGPEGMTYRVWLCDLGLPVRARAQTGDRCGGKSGSIAKIT